MDVYFDMTVKLKVTDEFKKFTIKLAADETYDSTITYDPVREVLSDRSRSGYMRMTSFIQEIFR